MKSLTLLTTLIMLFSCEPSSTTNSKGIELERSNSAYGDFIHITGPKSVYHNKYYTYKTYSTTSNLTIKERSWSIKKPNGEWVELPSEEDKKYARIKFNYGVGYYGVKCSMRIRNQFGSLF